MKKIEIAAFAVLRKQTVGFALSNATTMPWDVVEQKISEEQWEVHTSCQTWDE